MKQADVHLAHGFGGVGRAPSRRNDPSFGAQTGTDQTYGGARVNERAEYQSTFVQIHRSAATNRVHLKINIEKLTF